MKVHCKKDFNCFKNNEYYSVSGIHSIFEKDDFITLECYNNIYRFRLNKSVECVDYYIGINEHYFYNYFCYLKDERKDKIEHLDNL